MPHVSRRDFLNGVALSVAAGLAPADLLGAAAGRYPPALTGLRGQHDGSFDAAHALAREGFGFSIDGLQVAERYDLVVVGAGISGLAAAWFYRKAVGPRARILILDNHDDFGGHAKRNEFRAEDRLILGYGGSESLQSPKGLFSAVAKGLLADLGVDIARFETAFDRKLYGSLGLKRGQFFARETFGRDVLVPGDPVSVVDSEPESQSGRTTRDLIATYPVSQQTKADLIRLFQQPTDYFAGKSAEEKIALLKKTSYRDYLTKIVGLGDEAANVFQGRTLDFYAIGIDGVAAYDAMQGGYPGFAGLKLPDQGPNPYKDEPYIYHFPDGNASIARLMVRRLIRGVAPGRSMDDIVLAPFDYEKLDRPGERTRLRLDSTCVVVRNARDRVDLGYVRAGKLTRIAARHVVLAGFNMMIPHIMPELPAAQREALAENVKAPLVYTKVLVRDWKAWAALKVHSISAPMSYHCTVKLDYPVSLGGYQCPRDPSEPMGLHMVHVPGAPNQGLPARDQFRIGRQSLFETTFAQYEAKIRDELDRMLGPGGFESGRDILAITVNRWSHGYAYTANSLYDPEDTSSLMETARKPMGRVAIANSDAGWDAYAHTAIDQAERAVREVLGRR